MNNSDTNFEMPTNLPEHTAAPHSERPVAVPLPPDLANDELSARIFAAAAVHDETILPEELLPLKGDAEALEVAYGLLQSGTPQADVVRIAKEQRAASTSTPTQSEQDVLLHPVGSNTTPTLLLNEEAPTVVHLNEHVTSRGLRLPASLRDRTTRASLLTLVGVGAALVAVAVLASAILNQSHEGAEVAVLGELFEAEKPTTTGVPSTDDNVVRAFEPEPVQYSVDETVPLTSHSYRIEVPFQGAQLTARWAAADRRAVSIAVSSYANSDTRQVDPALEAFAQSANPNVAWLAADPENYYSILTVSAVDDRPVTGALTVTAMTEELTVTRNPASPPVVATQPPSELGEPITQWCSINLRSQRVIPPRTQCGQYTVIAEGDLDLSDRGGWNGNLSAWDLNDLSGRSAVRLLWEDWSTGELTGAGVVDARPGFAATEPAINDTYQQIDLELFPFASFTIWNNVDRTGETVTFYVQMD